jgi:hypothetical protein
MIKWEGNIERFRGQKKAKLIDVQKVYSKTISKTTQELVGKNVPENSVRQFILCTYIGDKNYPFQDILTYGGSRCMKLEQSIGLWFDIDSHTEEKQVELQMENQ